VNTVANNTVPPCILGQVVLTAGSVYSPNMVPAAGQLITVGSNNALFSLIGATYGGNDTTTFALPDLRSSAPNGMTYTICVSGAFP
jgi:microcystin-dependent protein